MPRDGGKPSFNAGPKIVHFERVVWNFVQDPSTAAEALQSGEVDWWETPPIDLVPQLKKNANLVVTVKDSTGEIGAPGKPAKRNDKNTQRWYLTIPRAMLFLTDAINLRRVYTRARKSNRDVIVFDRYIYDQLATLPLEKAWARAYARLLLKIAPRPDVGYLLDAVPEAALARKPEYPLDFLHKYRNTYLRLRDLSGMALIDPATPDEVHAAITEKLRTTCSHVQQLEKARYSSVAST